MTMYSRWPIATLTLVLAMAGVSQAFDTIKAGKNPAYGNVISVDATKIEFRQSSGSALVKRIPANQIETILFEGEPADLKLAKSHVLAGRYADALAARKKIEKTPEREAIRQDLDYYRALCASKLALAGNMNILEAGRMMKAFVDANQNSYHYFDAVQMVGDLLMANGSYGPAVEYYHRLAAAPWPDYKMRAGVAIGNAMLAQNKTNDAIAAFDKVLATDGEGKAAETQRMAASLGKAAALVALKKTDEAIKIVDGVLEKADPEDAPLMARAYDILGTAQRQAGRTKEALLAFLHVDLLYSSVPNAHAEALANLVDLWQQVHKTDRANRAEKTLMDRYPESPWAKKKGP
jgi:tetratricopeptide (TPR) repeat protein